MPPLSRRLPASVAPTAFARRLEALRITTESSLSWLDLTGSNPTRAGFAYPEGPIRDALSSREVLAYEPASSGHPRARGAVCSYYRDAHGLAVAPDDVVLTASTSEGYAYAFKLLCDPGDRALVPAPSYPLFDHLAALEGVALDAYPLRLVDGHFRIDLAELEARVTPRTRAVVLVSPNNPTGSFVQRSEREALRELCARHDVALVVDEVFADYALDARDDPSRAGSFVDERRAPAFVLSGLSKVCALPQVKLGWVVLAGPDSVRDFYRPRLELVADTYLSAGAPAQCAAAELLSLRAGLRAQVRARCEENLGALRSLAKGAPEAGVTALPVEGGWSAVLRVPAVQSEEQQVLALAERDRVLVQPGFFYDFAREGHLVVSLLTPPRVFSEGITRLLARQRAWLEAEG